MASQVLQTPQILSIEGSTIRIKHPDVSGYTRTSLTAPFTAAGVTLSVRDNNNFEDNDWFVLGELGNAKTEESDVNGAVSRGTSLTITNNTTFSHALDAPVTRIQERGIKIYGSATDGGAGTLIESIDAIGAGTRQIADAVMIQWDKPFTEWTLTSTDTAYAYYYVTFTDGTTASASSDYVLAAGNAYNTGKAVAQSALDLTRANVDGSLVTWEFLLDRLNDFQDFVASYVTDQGSIKDWPFEIFEDVTSVTILQNENSYAVTGFSETLKYPDSKQGIIQLRVGSHELQYIDLDEYERLMNGKVRTEVATSAAIGATSMVLDDTSELADSGSIYIGTQSAVITYTTKVDATNTISGIPASGTGSITATATVDAVVWQNISAGIPDKYTMFDGNILFTIPPNSDTAGKKLKIKAYKQIARLSSISDIIDIPFVHIAKWYVAAEIEYRKKNSQSGDRYIQRFEKEMAKAERKYLNHMPEVTDYYTFYTHPGTNFNE